MDEELTRLEALAAAATPGPWANDRRGEVAYCAEDCMKLLASLRLSLDVGHMDANAAFIAASRIAVPALVAEVRRLRCALGYAEQRVTLLRDELTAALDESRQALDAVHARCDAAERALVTASAEEREACVKVLRAKARAWHELESVYGDEATGLLNRVANEIEARGGDRG